MDLGVFDELGFTESERVVYLALLELGVSGAGQIIRKSGLHRQTVYAALDRLAQRGVVNHVSLDEVRQYECANPNILLTELHERERRLRELIPELALRKEIAGKKQNASFFDGVRGMRAIFDDISSSLEPGAHYVCLGAPKKAHDMLGEGFFSDFHKARIERGIPFRILHNDDARCVTLAGEPLPLTEVRYLPAKYSTPSSMEIYGDKVAIISWDDVPSGVIISSRSAARSFSVFFSMLWDMSTE